MSDEFATLGLSSDASPEQIQEAFARKRAEIVATIEDNVKRDEALAELQQEFDKLGKKKSLAIVDEAVPQREIPSLLSMVDSMTAPLRNESDHYATVACLHCGMQNPKEALICTSCGRQIARPCPKCGRILRIDAKVCSRCNTILLEYDQSRLYESEHIREVKDREREQSQIRVDALEDHHKKRALFGVAFWIIAVAVIVFLCLLTFVLVYVFGLNR